MTNGNDVAMVHLTKREWFAGMAMQGLIAGSSHIDFKVRPGETNDNAIARVSLSVADAMIAELNKSLDKG